MTKLIDVLLFLIFFSDCFSDPVTVSTPTPKRINAERSRHWWFAEKRAPAEASCTNWGGKRGTKQRSGMVFGFSCVPFLKRPLQLRQQLVVFKQKLEEFAMKHKHQINKDPEFRMHFNNMCTKIGVDPLACTVVVSSRIVKTHFFSQRKRDFGQRRSVWVIFTMSSAFRLSRSN